MNGKIEMEFSDLLNKCDLLFLSHYLVNGGELLEIPQKQSYEKTVRKAEKDLFDIARKFENRGGKYEETSAITGDSTTALRRTFFEMGVIAGIKLSHEFYLRAKELEE